MKTFLFTKIQTLPKNVILLGLVSCFNDIASEMIYPILPIFLTSVLQTPVPIVGMIEGIAEATASITKYLFGLYSDYLQKRKPFVVWGYSLGGISKFLIGFSLGWPLVLFARIIDKTGKGIRTAPRDSILLENATPSNKGLVFGFHRAFDSLGAVLGPLAALVCLLAFKNNIRLTFFIACIPSFIAVFLLIMLVKEKKRESIRQKTLVKISWHRLSPKLRLFLLVTFLFSLGNSSDAFLLLYAKSLGLTTTLVVLVYVLYNLSQAVFATPLGHLSDTVGAKRVFSGGLLVFAFVYFLFGSIAHQGYWLWLLFPLYGVYIASTDGVSKAYIAEFITKEESGTYFGAYYTLSAIGSFLASFIGGLLWSWINPSATFYYGSALAFCAFLLFLTTREKSSVG